MDSSFRKTNKSGNSFQDVTENLKGGYQNQIQVLLGFSEVNI